MLRMYETECKIGEAIDDFNNVRQMDKDSEADFAASLDIAAYRCVNVDDEY